MIDNPYLGDDIICSQYGMLTPSQHEKARREEAMRIDAMLEEQTKMPTIVCLCGSTRFSAAFQKANFDETLAGNIVLTIGCDMHSDAELFADKTESELVKIKYNLDKLHFRKIEYANEVLILNVGGYIGESTQRELEYARALGKRIRFLETEGE